MLKSLRGGVKSPFFFIMNIITFFKTLKSKIMADENIVAEKEVKFGDYRDFVTPAEEVPQHFHITDNRGNSWNNINVEQFKDLAKSL